MPVSESLNFMLKEVVESFIHPVAIGILCIIVRSLTGMVGCTCAG